VPPGSADDGALSKDAVTLKLNMRDLWADHVIWTRDYVVAAVANSPAAPAAAERLLKNQQEIGSAIGSFYGQAAGDSLASLLTEHINAAVDLVAAAKARNDTKLSTAETRAKTNAEHIATFLAGANPNWSLADLQVMLNDHLSLLKEEIQGRVARKWDADVSTFDKVYDQAMTMADALSDGILKQHPGAMPGSTGSSYMPPTDTMTRRDTNR
jgi:hypothetical protein